MTFNHPRFLAFTAVCALLADGLVGGVAYAAAASKAPVDFKAEQVRYDDNGQTVIATGRVELSQSGRVLKADEVRYNLAEDAVVARGNVVILEANGDVHFADEVEFRDSLRDGVAKGLRSTLVDGSRFWADEGTRQAGQITEMSDAAYTPCEPCKTDPDSAPPWRISAGKVTHDAQAKTVTYKDATFDVAGVPVFYTPYFSHPDGTVERKSGFLTPSFALDSELGASVKGRYYWDIAPDRDATFGLQAFTNQAPLLSGEYRQRYGSGEMKLNASTTYSDYIDSIGILSERTDDKLRGHLFGKGRWDLTEKWRAGFNAQLTSDDQYLRQYKISGKDVLENEAYAERFSGRDYFVARALNFQDLRVSERRDDQPDILPEIEASFLGEPGQILGGQWRADLAALGLQRTGQGQDISRLSGTVSWYDRYTTSFGLVTKVDARAQVDSYYLSDVDEADAEGDNVENRFFPSFNVETSYPLVRDFEYFQATIEPVASLTFVPNLNENKIPNEDSTDVQVDALNVFNLNRFPGYDKVEDQSRATYGVRSGLYDSDGSKFEMFLGQSHRFQSDDTTFPAGSGLDGQQSDYVGMIDAVYKDMLGLNYRFQLDQDSFESARHEVDMMINTDRFDLTATYLFSDAIAGDDLDFAREQVSAGASYLVTDTWRVRSGALYNLGENEGLRKANFGLDYLAQCYSLSATINRTLTQEQSGDSSTEIIFGIGLKNLGEFATSGLDIGGRSDSDGTDNDPKTAATTIQPAVQ